MNTHTHPGKGLSLSQLVFALNEELKQAVYSPSFTLDNLSQLDRDVSTVLANIRERRNTFIPINRLPLDVLSLIPTHIPLQKDRFRVSHVCRHWRRTFLQHAVLWSQFFLSKGEVYVKTLLERVKGSSLDVTTGYKTSVGTMSLLSPHAQQIRYLGFVYNSWTQVQKFSEACPGPLPLLHTLDIDIVTRFRSIAIDSQTVTPFIPLFGNAVNLKRLVLRSNTPPFLNRFVFPNLTTFELSAIPTGGFHAPELLNFLEASPMLRTIRMEVTSMVSLESIADSRVVILPNVQTFSLVVKGDSPGYELAAHISCPSASTTSLMHETDAEYNMVADEDIFPTSVFWNALVRQYTRSPVEVVKLKMRFFEGPVVACTLTFLSSDESAIMLGLEVSGDVDGEDEVGVALEKTVHEVFSQASRTIRNHPQLPSVTCLHIDDITFILDEERLMNAIEELFKSVGPLDELILSGCDLHHYVRPFIDPPELNYVGEPVKFPSTKELTILHPSWIVDDESCVAAIVGLTKSQHARGAPFERVKVRMRKLPEMMAEMLNPWVDVVDCCEKPLRTFVSHVT